MNDRSGDDAVIALAGGALDCTIDPATGGALLSLRWRGRDLLRPAPPGTTDVLRTASFPLVPFANRIAQGRFTFAGEAVQLPADRETPPHAHHGHGWRRAWQTVARGADHARIALDVAPGAWPWRYRAEQSIRIDGDVLRIDLSVANLSDRAMPAGAGIHPYLPRHPESRIVASANASWTTDAAGLPLGRVADPRFGGEAVAVASLEGVDHFFEGPADVLVLGGPVPVRVRGEPCAGFHLYVPPGEAFFCVEPVSHAPGSFVRGAFGADDVIGAGDTRHWRFEIGAG